MAVVMEPSPIKAESSSKAREGETKEERKARKLAKKQVRSSFAFAPRHEEGGGGKGQLTEGR